MTINNLREKRIFSLTSKEKSSREEQRTINEKKERSTTISTIICPYCSSENVYGISRIVGYFSVIDNWNNSKKSELKRRQKGNYWSDKNE